MCPPLLQLFKLHVLHSDIIHFQSTSCALHTVRPTKPGCNCTHMAILLPGRSKGTITQQKYPFTDKCDIIMAVIQHSADSMMYT